MRIFTVISLLLYTSLSVWGQARPLDRNYVFQDGVYLSYDSFRSDQPDWPLSNLEGRMVTNEETGLTKSDYLAVKRDTGAMPLALDDLWGICLDGKPYIRLEREAEEATFATFALLRVRGAICYFNFEAEEKRYVEVKAYNPLTGRPFRSARLPKLESVTRHKILHFPSGRTADLSRAALLDWIADDAPLTRTVAELPDTDIFDKLYRSVLVYNDRHPVYVDSKE